MAVYQDSLHRMEERTGQPYDWYMDPVSYTHLDVYKRQENIRTLPKMTRQALCASPGFDLMQPFAIVTYHPETSAAAGDPAAQADALCAAMEAVPGVFWLITGSNADAGHAVSLPTILAPSSFAQPSVRFTVSTAVRRVSASGADKS